jgi:hypothetical protein
VGQSKNFTNMKKISLVAFGCLAVVSVMAQDTQSTSGTTKDYKPVRTDMATKTRFGLAAGVNLAKLAFKDAPAGTTWSPTMKTSLYGGGFVNIPLGQMFRIQPGIFYNGLGSKVKTVTTTTTGGVSVTSTSAIEQDLHYLSIPVTLQFVPGNSGFFIQAGPQVGFLITARAQDETSGGSGTTTYNKSDYDKFDVGLHGGLGYITRIGLGFEAKYLAGLSNVFDDDGSKTGPEAKNRAWQFGLFYQFGAAK